jgi:hypothetical protein
MKFVTGEFEKFRRVSYTGCLAYGRQEATETLRWYVDVSNSAAVLDNVELKTIAHYIGMQRQHIASFIVNKPIFQSCVDGVRRRGSSIHQFWWAQPMDLERARAARLAGPVATPE